LEKSIDDNLSMFQISLANMISIPDFLVFYVRCFDFSLVDVGCCSSLVAEPEAQDRKRRGWFL